MPRLSLLLSIFIDICWVICFIVFKLTNNPALRPLYILFFMVFFSFLSYPFKWSRRIHYFANFSTIVVPLLYYFMVRISELGFIVPDYINTNYVLGALVLVGYSINVVSIIGEGVVSLRKIFRKRPIPSPSPIPPVSMPPPHPPTPQPSPPSIPRRSLSSTKLPSPIVTPIYPKNLSIIYKDRIIEVKSRDSGLPLENILHTYGIIQFNKIYGFDGFSLKDLNLEEKVDSLLKNNIFTIYIQ